MVEHEKQIRAYQDLLRDTVSVEEAAGALNKAMEFRPRYLKALLNRVISFLHRGRK